MIQVELLHAAAADLDAAYDWYEQQRPGLGAEFLSIVHEAFGFLRRFPDGAPIIHRTTRRFLLERFPYCLYYRVVDQKIIIVACMHAARDPAIWRGRLDG